MTPGPEKETTPGLYKGELEEPEPEPELAAALVLLYILPREEKFLGLQTLHGENLGSCLI